MSPKPPLQPVPPPPAALQDSAFQQIVAKGPLRQEGAGSAEIPQLLLPRAERNLGPQAAAELGLPSLAGAGAGITSPGMTAAPARAGEELPKKFWFNINAELVLYGATEPDAQVAIAGQPIRLRPDGAFSYRFALPDGITTWWRRPFRLTMTSAR